jgi:hypothetical protein
MKEVFGMFGVWVICLSLVITSQCLLPDHSKGKIEQDNSIPFILLPGVVV